MPEPESSPSNLSSPDPLPAAEVASSPEERERWQRGAHNFSDFLEHLPQPPEEYLRGLLHEEPEAEISAEENPQAVARQMAAVFLGEKPASFLTAKAGEELRDHVSSYHLKVYGRYLYDPAQVTEVMNAHPDAFEGYSEPEAVIQEVNQEEGSDERVRMRGLVMGFPRSAVEQYVERQHLLTDSVLREVYIPGKLDDTTEDWFHSITPHLEDELRRLVTEQRIKEEEIPMYMAQLARIFKRQGVSIHDIRWAEDYTSSPESQARQARLRTAFEESGVLDVLKKRWL